MIYFFPMIGKIYKAFYNVSNFDVETFRFPKLLSNWLLSSVCFIQRTNHHGSQETGFENSPHSAFILFQRWPVQLKALSCMLMLSRVLHLLLMCCICRYLLLYITPSAPHITSPSSPHLQLSNLHLPCPSTTCTSIRVLSWQRGFNAPS